MGSKSEREKRKRRLLSEQYRAQLEQEKIEATRQREASGLPELLNWHGAWFGAVAVGPRHDLALTLLPLVWVGTQAQHGPAVVVRLSGIVNFDEVKTLFAANHHKRSELGRLDYAVGYNSKPGDLYLQLAFERVEASVVIHCHSLIMTEPEGETG